MADETKPKDAKPKKEAKPAADKPEKGEKAKASGKPTAEARGAAKAPGAVAGATPAAPAAAELLGDDAAARKIIKAKGSKNVFAGVANILATFNNTTVSICDMH